MEYNGPYKQVNTYLLTSLRIPNLLQLSLIRGKDTGVVLSRRKESNRVTRSEWRESEVLVNKRRLKIPGKKIRRNPVSKGCLYPQSTQSTRFVDQRNGEQETYWFTQDSFNIGNQSNVNSCSSERHMESHSMFIITKSKKRYYNFLHPLLVVTFCNPIRYLIYKYKDIVSIQLWIGVPHDSPLRKPSTNPVLPSWEYLL